MLDDHIFILSPAVEISQRRDIGLRGAFVDLKKVYEFRGGRVGKHRHAILNVSSYSLSFSGDVQYTSRNVSLCMMHLRANNIPLHKIINESIKAMYWGRRLGLASQRRLAKAKRRIQPRLLQNNKTQCLLNRPEAMFKLKQSMVETICAKLY